MAIDAGDSEEKYTVTLDAGSNSVSGGDAVKFDGSGNITKTTANDDDYVGVVLPTTIGDDTGNADGDSMESVHVCGLVVNVNVDGSISAGDTLVPSGSTNGQWIAHGNGMYEGNPDTSAGAIAANHPFALEDGSDGDTIRACFR